MKHEDKMFIAGAVGTFVGTIIGCYLVAPSLQYLLLNKKKLKWRKKKKHQS